MRAARALVVWLWLVAGCGEVVGDDTEMPMGTISISPASPRTADELIAASSGDGTVQWSKNGTVRSDVTGDRVAATLTAKGETWTADLVTETGVVIATDTVTIANTPPTAPDARVEGTAVLTTPLRCLLIGTTTDADSDPITYTVTWQKNGAPYTTATMTTLAGDTVPAADRAAGDDFLCTLSASDGSDSLSATAGAEWFSPDGMVAGMGTIQMFTVPADVSSLFVEAGGAEGGFSDVMGGTYGARLAGTFALTAGTQIQIVVGQPPASSLAGGGGTFVVGPGNMPLVIAGGGGSKNAGTIAPTESQGRIVTSGGTAGTAGRANNGAGGLGTPNSNSGAGGGFMTNGAGTGGGKAFVNGGAGAGTEVLGGFGGGGGRSGLWGQGGGGGYSGGSCGDTYDGVSNGTWVGCGGGGSINMGTSPVNTAGAVAGPGYVFIVW